MLDKAKKIKQLELKIIRTEAKIDLLMEQYEDLPTIKYPQLFNLSTGFTGVVRSMVSYGTAMEQNNFEYWYDIFSNAKDNYDTMIKQEHIIVQVQNLCVDVMSLQTEIIKLLKS